MEFATNGVVHNWGRSQLGLVTNVVGHKCDGHKRDWSQMVLIPIGIGHKCDWSQMGLITNGVGHKCGWSHMEFATNGVCY